MLRYPRYSAYPAGTQRCFNVVLMLIFGRDVEQLIFNVEPTLLLLILTSEKQPIFYRRFTVRFQR